VRGVCVPSDGRAVAAELERAAGLGCVGAMVYGRTGDTPLDDPCYEELFVAAAALKQPIFIHPQIPTNAVRSAAYSGLGAMTDLALSTFVTTVDRLLFSTDYPFQLPAREAIRRFTSELDTEQPDQFSAGSADGSSVSTKTDRVSAQRKLAARTRTPRKSRDALPVPMAIDRTDR